MPHHPPSRTAFRLTAAGLAAGCVLAGLGTSLSAAAAPGPSVRTSTSALSGGGTVPVGAARPVSGRWTAMARSGLPATDAVTGAWTGRELLVVGVRPAGGNAPVTAVAAGYSPTADRWRRAAAPAPERQRPQTDLTSVWTGRELFVWGQVRQAYDPARNRWRPLPDPPVSLGASHYVLAWTGKVVLAWGGACCASAERAGAAYDPATNRWTALPDSPLSRRAASGVWTGRELVIVGGNDFDGATFRDGAAYNPATRTWRRLPALPALRGLPTVIWTGQEVLVVGGTPGRAAITAQRVQFAYSPTRDRWRSLTATVPAGAALTGVWTGRQALIWAGGVMAGERVVRAGGVSYTPASGTWATVPAAPLTGRMNSVVAWTGREFLVWGGGHAADGARYRP